MHLSLGVILHPILKKQEVSYWHGIFQHTYIEQQDLSHCSYLSQKIKKKKVEKNYRKMI